MATYTSNYGLHQWAPEDNFLRTDFNEDFKKIDTALGQKASASTVSSLQSQVSSMQSSLSGKAEFVTGSYAGDMQTGRSIYLGFYPKAVICFGRISTVVSSREDQCSSLTITSTGFQPNRPSDSVDMNQGSVVYTYVAFR